MIVHDRETNRSINTTVEKWKYVLDYLCDPTQPIIERQLTLDFDTIEEYKNFSLSVSKNVKESLDSLATFLSEETTGILKVNYHEIHLDGFGSLKINYPLLK